MTTQLNDGDIVRLPDWRSINFATVGIADDRELARSRGHDDVWAIYTGATITDCRQYFLDDQAKYRRSIVLHDGEPVIIGGAGYEVKVVRGNTKAPRNSDPIHFTRLPGLTD